METVTLGEILALLMFATACGVLLMGYHVAFSLAGTALAFALLGSSLDVFDLGILQALPSRYFGVMTNQVLVAVPLFVFMGVMLERSRIAEDLLTTMGMLFGNIRGGLGIAVVIVGALLAASTGIVGATVVTMGLLSLPAMLKGGYDPRLACGIICASGTLGQIIPPSIVLVLLGDTMQGVYSEVQLEMGNFAPDPVSVNDLFAASILPGFLLVGLYILWVILVGIFRPESCPPVLRPAGSASLGSRVLRVLLPPLSLIILVLGSILFGIATITEGAAMGAIGALVLAGGVAKPAESPAGDAAAGRGFLARLLSGQHASPWPLMIAGAALMALMFLFLQRYLLFSDVRAPEARGLMISLENWLPVLLIMGGLVLCARHLLRWRGQSNMPIFASVIAVAVIVFLVRSFDLGMRRNELPTADVAAAIIAALACGVLFVAILVSVGRCHRSGVLAEVMQSTLRISSMVFVILLGASVFSLVFRELGGDKIVEDVLSAVPGGKWGMLLAVMLLMFFLGFFLDFMEIIFVMVPIVGPVLLKQDINPIWLGVLIAVNLQTSFLTPPFGFALFYLRGVAPPEVTTMHIYRGVVPFIIIQWIGLILLALFPQISLLLPEFLYGTNLG